MNAVRIHRRLEAPIAEFPEMTPMVGKNVEIIVIEEPDRSASPSYDFWNGPGANELSIQQGVVPIASPEDLHGKDDMREAFEGFDEWLRETRRQPWRKQEG